MSDQKSEKPVAGKVEGDDKAKRDAKPAADVKPKATPAGLPLPLIGAAVGALVLGSVLGVFVVAPRIVAARTGAQGAADGAEGKPGKKAEHGKPAKAKGGHGEKGGGESAVHKIENLIVNPAGSQGRRFLMMSVAIEVPDTKTEAALRLKDAMLRDAIIGALERQPIGLITSPGGRDSVRAAIQRVVEPLVEEAEWVHIYLPQFVLQ
jgi:flagellar basal body-associated protein FliL